MYYCQCQCQCQCNADSDYPKTWMYINADAIEITSSSVELDLESPECSSCCRVTVPHQTAKSVPPRQGVNISFAVNGHFTESVCTIAF